MQRNGAFSSARGKIKKIFIAFPHYPDPGHVQRVKALWSALPERIGLVLWCNQYEDGVRLQTDLAGHDIKAALYLPGLPPSSWPRCVILAPKPQHEVDYPRWTRDPFIFCPAKKNVVRILNSDVVHGNETFWAERFLDGLCFLGGLSINWNKNGYR